MLNACRRQRNLHPECWSGPFCTTAMCSTPVGVKGISTFNVLERVRWSACVLNACRRQRNLHGRRRVTQIGPYRCSTPVGVKGISTATGIVAGRFILGAQRLSASKESPLADAARHRQTPLPGAQRLSASKEFPPSPTRHEHSHIGKCSTPVGVKGISTGLVSPGEPGERRCSTPVGVKGISTGIRTTVRAIVAGAQRLSASKESPPVDAFAAVTLIPSCSTPVGVKGISTALRPARGRARGGVLNACRRQRNLHWSSSHPIKTGELRCSTPVGVKGISTSRRFEYVFATSVLNACRRQRNLHWDLAVSVHRE